MSCRLHDKAWRVAAALGLACVPASWAAESANALRDPTRLPAALQEAQAAPADAGGAPADAAPAMPFFIMAKGGRRYVIHSAHQLGVGDELDGARIQRIDEDAVWLLEAGRLRRVEMYANVAKRKASMPAASAAVRKPFTKAGQRRRHSLISDKDVP